MKLALSAGELASGQALDMAVDTAIELGITHLEMWYPRNFQTLGLKATLDLLSNAGLQICCVASPTELWRGGGSLDDQRLLLEAIDVAAAASAPNVVTYFGSASEVDDERAIDDYCTLLAPCLERAKALGITICLENEFDLFGLDPKGTDASRRPTALKKLVEQAGAHRFRLNFDACNFHFAGIDAVEALDLLIPYVSYIHLKDGHPADDLADSSPGKSFVDSGKRWATTPMGSGVVNWQSILGRLIQEGYRGFAAAEPHLGDLPVIEAWHQSVTWLRRVLATDLPPMQS